MADVIITFDTVREQAIYTAYSTAVKSYIETLTDDTSTAGVKATALAAVVAAYPAFIKVLKFKVGADFHKGFVFLNKFIAYDGLSTIGLKDITTKLAEYTAATTVEDGKASHDALVLYLDNNAFFVQEFARMGGFSTDAFTASGNNDLSRVAQVNAAVAINDGGISIFIDAAGTSTNSVPEETTDE